MTKIYMAGPLFTEGEQMFNESFKRTLLDIGGSDFDIYLPQENMDINDKSEYVSPIDIFNADTNELLDSDILIACLDGTTIDSGVAMEIGLFKGTHPDRPIFGFTTDIRAYSSGGQSGTNHLSVEGNLYSSYQYYNLYVVGGIEDDSNSGGYFTSTTDVINALLKELNLKID